MVDGTMRSQAPALKPTSKHPAVPHLDLKRNTPLTHPVSITSRLEAWNALNKRIIVTSQWSQLRHSCSSVRSLRESAERISADPPEGLKKQVAQVTAPLLDMKLMLLEAAEALAETQPTVSHPSTVRKRALAASARKQLRLVQKGTQSLKSIPSPHINPFRLDSNLPRTTKQLRSSQPSTPLTGMYRQLYHKYFEHRMTSALEHKLADREDYEMRESLSHLRQSLTKRDHRLKPDQVAEAVAAFKSEKLAFVYGPQFRGRYISRTHGDLLKD